MWHYAGLRWQKPRMEHPAWFHMRGPLLPVVRGSCRSTVEPGATGDLYQEEVSGNDNSGVFLCCWRTGPFWEKLWLGEINRNVRSVLRGKNGACGLHNTQFASVNKNWVETEERKDIWDWIRQSLISKAKSQLWGFRSHNGVKKRFFFDFETFILLQGN